MRFVRLQPSRFCLLAFALALTSWRTDARTVSVSLDMDATGNTAADLFFGAAADGETNTLFVAWGAADGGDGTNGWEHVARVSYLTDDEDVLLPGQTTFRTALPDGWGKTVGAVRYFLFAGETGFPYETRRAYIQSGSGQWLDTGIVPDVTTTIELIQKYGYDPTFGVAGLFYCFDNGNALYYGLGANGPSPFAHYTTGTKHTMSFGSAGAYIDGALYGVPANQTAFETTYTVILFGRRTTAGVADRFSDVTLWSTKMRKGGVLVRDYVPCHDGKAFAFYDRVSRALARSQTSTAFDGSSTVLARNVTSAALVSQTATLVPPAFVVSARLSATDAGGTVTGAVSRWGSPIAGATVRLLLGTDAASLSEVPGLSATTDADGAYELSFSGLEPLTSYFAQTQATAGDDTVPSALIPFETTRAPRTLTATLAMDATDGMVAELHFGATDDADTNTLFVAWGAADGGDATNGWEHVARVSYLTDDEDVLLPGQTTFRTALPDGWGKTVGAVRYFLFAGETGFPYDARVEFLASTTGGHQWIDTGVVPDGTTSVEVDHTSENNMVPFGLGEYLYFFGNDYYCFYSYTSANQGEFHDLVSDYVYTMTRKKTRLGPDGIFENGAALVSPWPTEPSSVAGTYPIALFGRMGTDGVIQAAKFGAFSIWSARLEKAGAIVRDFVPCRVGTTAALYDRVSQTLFRNADTSSSASAFVRGCDIAVATADAAPVASSATLNFADSAVMVVSVVRAGTGVTLTGLVSRSGVAASGAAVRLAMGATAETLEDTGIATVSAADGSFAIPVTGLSPDTTYFGRFDATFSGGDVVSSGVFPFVTLGAVRLGETDVTLDGNVLTVAGTLDGPAAGVTSVSADWWIAGATVTNRVFVTALAEGETAFSCAIAVPWHTRPCVRIVYENACGGKSWKTATAETWTLETVDGEGAVYTWKGGDGVWTNAANWAHNDAARADWPGSGGTAVFGSAVAVSGLGAGLRIDDAAVTADDVRLTLGDGDALSVLYDLNVTGARFRGTFSGTAGLWLLSPDDGTRGLHLRGTGASVTFASDATNFRKIVEGSGNVVTIARGYHSAKISIVGEDNLMRITGSGTCVTSNAEIACAPTAFRNRLVIERGAVLHVIMAGDCLSTTWSLQGANNAVEIDDATVMIEGLSEKETFNVGGETGRTNDCFVFRGKAPSLVIPRAKFGVKGSLPIESPVRFKYVLPPTNYAAAPLRVTGETYFYGNTVIEVDRRRRLAGGRVPLATVGSVYWGGANLGVVLQQLNDNAILPPDVKLSVSDDGLTLYCDLRPIPGTCVFVR